MNAFTLALGNLTKTARQPLPKKIPATYVVTVRAPDPVEVKPATKPCQFAPDA